MAPKPPADQPIERRHNPFSNIENSVWGKKVEGRLTNLEQMTEVRHEQNTKSIDELKAAAAENRKAIDENTRITKAGFEELLPVVKGLRVAKNTGKFAWAGAILASKLGRWLAGFVGLVTTVLYLLHEKWIDAWKAFLKLFA